MTDASARGLIAPPPLLSPTVPKIAILIPCFNEEQTVGQVVDQFRSAVPEAEIYVFDNNSTDRTIEIALSAGATVFTEPRQGKGFVVQSMFGTVEADVYVMTDGDDTYPADAVRTLIDPILQGQADMVIGSRLHPGAQSEFRAVNRLGNDLFLLLVRKSFGVHLTDLLSGYRGFSRRLVRGIPLFSGGFDTEAELTIRALQRGFRVLDVPVNLSNRPEGSESKIRVLRDGWKILAMILALLRDYKPLTFFGSLGLVMIALALIPGTIVLKDFLATGLVPRLPSAILALGLVMIGAIIISVGVILHTISRRFQQLESQLQISTDEDYRRHLNLRHHGE